jgi:hypothetical protein
MGLKGYRLWVNLIQRAEPHHERHDQPAADRRGPRLEQARDEGCFHSRVSDWGYMEDRAGCHQLVV